MEKWLFFSVSALVFSVCGFSQNLPVTKVPNIVKEGFKKLYPTVATSWEREGVDYEVNFKEGGKSMSCVIDKQGTILETESAIDRSELPEGARKYIQEHLKGKKLKEIAKIERKSAEVEFELNAGGKDVLFDRSGNILQKAKEKKDKR